MTQELGAKPPSILRLFVEGHKYLCSDSKRLLRALTPLGLVYFISSLCLTFLSGSAVFSLFFLALFIYASFFFAVIFLRDLATGRNEEFSVPLFPPRRDDVKAGFLFFILLIASTLAWVPLLISLLVAYILKSYLMAYVLIWAGLMACFYLSAIVVRWAFVVPALYQGEALSFKGTRKIARHIMRQILLYVLMVFGVFFMQGFVYGYFDQKLLHGVYGAPVDEALRNIYMAVDTALTLYLWGVFSFVLYRLYLWGKEHQD